MRVEVRTAPFDPAAELAAFAARAQGAGGVASFIGVCRAASLAGPVEALVLDHYPGFTEAEIVRLTDAAIARFALIDACVLHRAGEVRPGEAIVLAAAAAPHRRAAFDAVDWLMDHLKTEAPFWKQERGPDGARWIEPRAEDHADKARWTPAVPNDPPPYPPPRNPETP
jgi:molybdopterin synthase catalytic subunit